jgi:hypothetical protein
MNNAERKRTERIRGKWSKVTNIASIVAVLTGIALSGSLSYDGHSIAWDLPGQIETWITVLFIVASALAGKGKFEVKKFKKILGK